jgi:hypothetical protein
LTYTNFRAIFHLVEQVFSVLKLDRNRFSSFTIPVSWKFSAKQKLWAILKGMGES